MILEELKKLKSKHKETDRQIIGDIYWLNDEGQIWITSNNIYIWHLVIGEMFRPKKIMEIGTRFGYSLKALVEGAGWPTEDYVLWSVDNDQDNLGSMQRYFGQHRGFNFNQIFTDVKGTLCLRIPEPMDLCHVDANDTVFDTYRNCVLAIECLKDGGVLLCDDLDGPNVKIGWENFCRDYHLEPETLPTLHQYGIAINNGKWRDDIKCQFMHHDYPQKKYLCNAINSNMTVLDVGCGHAEYSRLFARLAKHVIAFEPCDSSYAYSRSILPANVTLENVALGDSEYKSNFYAFSQFWATGYSSIRKPVGQYSRLPFNKKKVKVISLDKYMEDFNIGHVDFVKVDIEGGERDFFRGASKLLEMRPIIMCELGASRTEDFEYEPKEVSDMLESKGYVWFAFNEDGSLFKSLSVEGNASGDDFIAIPKEKL